MTPEEKSPKLRFDGTVNWTVVIAVIGALVGTIGFGNQLFSRIDSVQEAMLTQAGEVKELKESVDNIRLDLASKDGLQKMVQDHEARIRSLEAK